MIKKSLVALALAGAVFSAQASVVAINEGFNNVAGLQAAGWTFTNASTPVGARGWFQGTPDTAGFNAFAGPANSFIAANYFDAAPGGVINNYLITPLFNTGGLVTASFFGRGANDAGFSDQIAFGFSSGTSTAIDTFTFGPIVTVPTDAWKNYTATSLGNGAGSQGRFAIRYTGLADQSNYLGIDSLSVTTIPEPSTIMILGAGMLGLLALRRRKQI